MSLYTTYIPHYRTLLHIGVPIIIAQLGTIIMGFADTLMVGRYGAQELAAAGFVNNIIGLALITSQGFSYGLTPIVSSLWGEGKKQCIAQQLKNSLLANSLVSLFFITLLGIIYFYLDRLGLPIELMPLIRPYYAILTLSILPHMLFMAWRQFSEGIQDTRTPMWVMIGANLLNILLNFLFIFGYGPFPEWGLMGAGFATLTSRLVQWLAMVTLFHRSKRYTYHITYYKSAIYTKSHLVTLYRMGVPIALQLGAEMAAFSLSALYVGWIGTVALATHQVMITISQLCFLQYYGLGASVAIMVSYYQGKQEHEKSKEVALAGLHLTWLIGVCMLIPIYYFRNELGTWFTDTAEVTTLLPTILFPFMLYQAGDAMQVIYANALRGISDVKSMMWIAIFSYIVVSLPLGYFFGFILNGGLRGIWMAFPFGLTLAGVLYYTRFTYIQKKLSSLPAPL